MRGGKNKSDPSNLLSASVVLTDVEKVAMRGANILLFPSELFNGHLSFNR